MQKKIITVTLNTSVDLTIYVPALTDNSVVDASDTAIVAGGKGINVARVLGILGEPVIALGLVGRESAELFSTIGSPLVHTEFVYLDGPSRQNITIVETGNGSTTHIRTKGFEALQNVVDEVTEELRDKVANNDIVILSGSLPPGVREHTYSNLVALCNEKGAFVILDTSGVPFLNAISSKPFLIKPNLAELLSIYGPSSKKSDTSVLNPMIELGEKGITLVSVSLGPKGVLMLDTSTRSFIKGSISLGSEYTYRKPVGSGDAMLAGFAFALKNGLGVHEMIRLGVACGAANTISRLMNTDDLYRIESLRVQVQIEDLFQSSNR